MTCTTVLSIIDEYVMKELVEEAQAFVRQHLDTCPSCVAEATRLTQYFRLMSRADYGCHDYRNIQQDEPINNGS